MCILQRSAYKGRKLSTLAIVGLLMTSQSVQAQVSGVLPSYNDGLAGKIRTQQYYPEANAFVCENGNNRFTRALYGGWTDYRIETSDRPVFALVKKNHHRHLRFLAGGVPLDSTDYCKAYYVDGMRRYLLRDRRWGDKQMLEVQVVACPDREGGVWWFRSSWFENPLLIEARLCEIANPRLQRNGDIGADKPGVFEAAPGERGLQRYEWQAPAMDGSHQGYYSDTFFVIDSINRVVSLPAGEARCRFASALGYNRSLANRIQFQTPDPYINTLGGALSIAADGDWDGKTWLHGCIGWRMPLAGWRAAYVGDVLGWADRARCHFDAYARSQVTEVPPVRPHPSQDPKMNMARAEKAWGTQMYSNGYICRNPERNDQMHHYDMNLNYVDELLWHFQYDADTLYMRKMWPTLQRHLEWEKRNYDPDGDHLYDAYCCIWASDALYYSGGAVTHSSAYNYRANLLVARIAEIIGQDATPYRQEAEAIMNAMNKRLWMPDKGVWAECQDAMGLKRLHESPAVWSVYTPIDCGVCTPEQAWRATDYVTRELPHIEVAPGCGSTIATSNWMPYSWSINNVAPAEVMHTALAYFEAGRADEGFRLLRASVLDNMYYGQSPANFGQLSHLDAARGECYRDFGDVIGIGSRALIQGLFGIVPDALHGRCILRPGFPEAWDSVSITTPYISYAYVRRKGTVTIDVTQRFVQPLQLIVRQNIGDGRTLDIEGTKALHQVLTYERPASAPAASASAASIAPVPVGSPDGSITAAPMSLGLSEPDLTRKFRRQDLSRLFNARVDDIFKNRYETPRPMTTTLQIPLQGIGEWCHPQYTPTISDSVFRTLVTDGCFNVAGVPFSTPAEGKNIVYTSLWDNYPDSVLIPVKGKAASAYLLMAGSTNHMQSRIDNALIVATYRDGTTDTLRLRNPDNWCPIEQDYYVDDKAFYTIKPRPYRVCLGTGTVSRDLGQALGISGVYGREIPGGAAQLLRMPLNPAKPLRSITLRTLSNDVVVGLMGITLQ